MIRTGKQIQGDVYAMLRDSDLARGLSGGVYRSGQRPRDSRLEDAVVVFTAGTPTQIQAGVVTVNVFYGDTERDADGVMYEDGARGAELESMAQRWVEGLTASRSGYRFQLQRAITSDYDPSCGQHFVVVSLGYELYDGD